MKWLAIGLACLAALVAAVPAYYSLIVNPRVIGELHADPDGARAQKVMILTLPSGKAIPVNYLRDGDRVYAAADLPWWRELRGGGGRGSVFIRGESHDGHVRVVEDDPALRDSVFDRLRPTAARWAGTLVVIELDAP